MFWEKFLSLSNEKGISPSYAVSQLGLAHGCITQWKKGAMPRQATLRKIADYFGVSVEYLLNGDLPDGVRTVQMQRIPLVGQIACGRPIFAEEERGQYVDAPTEVKADLALTVKGESMADVGIHDGDIVFVRKQLTVENGEIAAVIIDNEATLKRWYFKPEEQKLVLMPENADFDPIEFQGKELTAVNCLGLAVCVMRDRFIRQIENSPTSVREQQFLAVFRRLSDEGQDVLLASLLASLNNPPR